MTSTTGQSIDHSEWSGTEQLSREFQFVEPAEFPPFQIRIVNGLDAEITVDVRLTDALDGEPGARSRLADPLFYTGSKTVGWPPTGGFPGSQSTQQTLTLSAGEFDTYAIPSSWDVVQYRVTPTTNPSSGEVQLINMK